MLSRGRFGFVEQFLARALRASGGHIRRPEMGLPHEFRVKDSEDFTADCMAAPV